MIQCSALLSLHKKSIRDRRVLDGRDKSEVWVCAPRDSKAACRDDITEGAACAERKGSEILMPPITIHCACSHLRSKLLIASIFFSYMCIQIGSSLPEVALTAHSCHSRNNLYERISKKRTQTQVSSLWSQCDGTLCMLWLLYGHGYQCQQHIHCTLRSRVKEGAMKTGCFIMCGAVGKMSSLFH